MPHAANPYEPLPYVTLTHPDWSKNATIYQINTRQFTEEGTLQAAARHLPRLQELGVVIVWLMPIHEIGVVNRKGSLGSPYAVKDYYSVNPEFGTLADLQDFVNEAHALGMYVILDWVANHSAWDHLWVTEHPDWYARDWQGALRPTPWWDWDDIIEFDFDQPDLRRAMTEAMKYWVTAADIDGYRCDVAGFVPTDFWNQVRRELDQLKPVFMLAEWESRDLHAASFDMTYAWSWYDAVHNVIMGKAPLSTLFVYYSWNERAFPKDSMRMTFVSNHDKNAWEGTEFENFGDGLEAAIVLSGVADGMPLMYNGQEAGNAKRLAFFERDSIEWCEHPLGELYKKLFALKKDNTALWNGKWGATMLHVPNDQPTLVFSFIRQNEVDKVFALFNFSAVPQTVAFHSRLAHGIYHDYFGNTTVEITDESLTTIEPWGYRVYVQ